MTDDLSHIRDQLHRKSNEYFVFEIERCDREKRNMFYGATDALLDAGMATRSYEELIDSNTGANLLVCYGFLQALYIQQDAVRTLSLALGIEWHPNNDPVLKKIRNIRNRLTGHPSLAGEKEKPLRPSSAILPYHDITKKSFRGHIYYEDGSEFVTIDVSSILAENESALITQMLEIEKKMDDQEREFRLRNKTPPLGLLFERGFSYLMQRLWCDLRDEGRLIQAENHLTMLREHFKKTHAELEERQFGGRSTALQMKKIAVGLNMLEQIMKRESFTEEDQHEFDIAYDGLTKAIAELRAYVSEVDKKLSAPL